MKKKHFKEGVDYTIHEYKRKKFKTSKKPICPICLECKNKKICLNRKSKEISVYSLYTFTSIKI